MGEKKPGGRLDMGKVTQDGGCSGVSFGWLRSWGPGGKRKKEVEMASGVGNVGLHMVAKM